MKTGQHLPLTNLGPGAASAHATIVDLADWGAATSNDAAPETASDQIRARARAFAEPLLTGPSATVSPAAAPLRADSVA